MRSLIRQRTLGVAKIDLWIACVVMVYTILQHKKVNDSSVKHNSCDFKTNKSLTY